MNPCEIILQLSASSPDKIAAVQALFKPYFDVLSIPMPELNPVIPSKFGKQVQALLEIKPAVFSHFWRTFAGNTA